MNAASEKDRWLREVAEWLSDAKLAVAFSGAGVSTESGIPDFRSPGGVWATSQPVYFDEFLRSAAARHEYWRQKSLTHQTFKQALPNAGHQTLAKWEQLEYLQALITQNIDGLHQIAGSQLVLELHGTGRFVACLACQRQFDAEEMVTRFLADNQPPTCPDCGGLTKHATVSFGQTLPTDVLERAIEFSTSCDLFLAIGSSLVVQPAASLPAMAKEHGARLVIINRDPTSLDRFADVVIRQSIGVTLQEIDHWLTEMAT